MPDDLDQIWKALADPTRRTILDFLRAGPRKTTEIVDQFPDLSRFAVMKHLDVLRQAALVLTRRKAANGSMPSTPCQSAIYERWVSHYEDLWANTLVRVKAAAEVKAVPIADAGVAKVTCNERSPKPGQRRTKCKQATLRNK